MRDFYETLGVSPNASLDEIKKAYRRKVLLHHPDLDATRNRDLFVEINHAYAVISDPGKRRDYDRERLTREPSGEANARKSNAADWANVAVAAAVSHFSQCDCGRVMPCLKWVMSRMGKEG